MGGKDYGNRPPASVKNSSTQENLRERVDNRNARVSEVRLQVTRLIFIPRHSRVPVA